MDTDMTKAINDLIAHCNYRVDRAHMAAKGDVMSMDGAQRTIAAFTALAARLRAMLSE